MTDEARGVVFAQMAFPGAQWLETRLDKLDRAAEGRGEAPFRGRRHFLERHDRRPPIGAPMFEQSGACAIQRPDTPPEGPTGRR